MNHDGHEGLEGHESQIRSVTLGLLMLWVVWSSAGAQTAYDLVIARGRVIDPETGFDQVADIAIAGNTIVRISREPLRAQQTVDASGLVVAPGFIDLHSHGQDRDTDTLKLFDGVTTALELEIGYPDVGGFLARRAGTALVNYGTAVSHAGVRAAAFGVSLAPGVLRPPQGPATDGPVTADILARMSELLGEGLDAGALGIGMSMAYTPGANRAEVVDILRVAARRDVPVFVHARGAGQPDVQANIDGISEIIAAAAVSSAGVHVEHVTRCRSAVRECLRLIEDARARGLDVTVEAYPYTEDRSTLDTQDVDAAIVNPIVMIASDAPQRPIHPRSAGTYARVLSRYVRELRTLTLMDAIRKMSLMPAQRLERVVPAARKKGRLQEGADADIVIFDPQGVRDRSTYEAPAVPSVGIRHVLVNGALVVRNGELVPGVQPGRAITTPVR